MNKTLKFSLVAILLLFAGIQSIYAIFFHLNGVFADQWDLLPILQRYYEGANWIEAALKRHAEHFHASAYLIMIYLASLSQWNVLWEVYTIIFFNLFSFFILYKIAIKPLSNHLNNFTFLCFVLLGGIYFSLVHSINLIWTWQLAVHITVFGMMLTLWGLSREKLNPVYFSIAVLGALFASFAFTCGFAIWPMGGLLILLHRNLGLVGKIIYLSFWCLITFALILYFYSTPGTQLPQDIQYNIGKIFLFVMYALGMSVSFFSRDFSLIVSIIGCVFAFFFSINVFLKAKTAQHVTLFNISLALIAFSLVVLVLIAIGRLEYGYGQARSARYVIFSQFFWIGLLLQICIYFTLVNTKSWQNTRQYMLGFFIVITLASSLRGADDGYDMHYTFNKDVYEPFMAASDEEKDDVLEKGTLKHFPHYPPRPILQSHIEFLKKHKLNFYRE